MISLFEYKPLQEAHIAEHFKPVFLQLQVVVPQPMRHLHDTLLSSSGRVGSLSVVIGINPFEVTF